MRKRRPLFFASAPPTLALRGIAFALALPAWRAASRSHLFTFGLCRREPVFSADFRDFPQSAFSEKWSYLPSSPGKISRIRQFLPGALRRAENSAGAIFPSAQNRCLTKSYPQSGTSLAMSSSGKTPERASAQQPERRDHMSFSVNTNTGAADRAAVPDRHPGPVEPDPVRHQQRPEGRQRP